MIQQSQPEQLITSDQFSFYSIISNPSFKAFEKLPDWQKAKSLESMGFVREVMLANLNQKQVQIVLNCFELIDNYLAQEEFDLVELANSNARTILSYAIVSMGSEQEFLKKMLTSYSIHEQKTEEKAYQEFKDQQKEEKKDKWKFFGK